jgi:hypothetical protein
VPPPPWRSCWRQRRWPRGPRHHTGRLRQDRETGGRHKHSGRHGDGSADMVVCVKKKKGSWPLRTEGFVVFLCNCAARQGRDLFATVVPADIRGLATAFHFFVAELPHSRLGSPGVAPCLLAVSRVLLTGIASLASSTVSLVFCYVSISFVRTHVPFQLTGT